MTYPLDTIRARLAFQVSGEHIYNGIAHTAVTIFKDVIIIILFTIKYLNINVNYYETFFFCLIKQEGGVRALYRGFWPTIIGMIPYAGFSFYSFEYLKYFSMKYFPQYLCNDCSRNTGKSRTYDITKIYPYISIID